MWPTIIGSGIAAIVIGFCAYFWHAKMPHPKKLEGEKAKGVVEYVVQKKTPDGTVYTPIVRYSYMGEEYVNEAVECAGILWPGTNGQEVYIRIDPDDPNRISARVTSESIRNEVIGILAAIGAFTVLTGAVSLVRHIVWLASIDF